MNIRKGQLQDAAQLAELLSQLDYPATTEFVEGKLRKLLHHPDVYCLVAVDGSNRVIGFISLHFIPQLGLEGDFCRISYFCIDQQSRSQRIGKLLEERAVEVARERRCDRIEVHCHIRRTHAHRFYERQGYVEAPKYLSKKLVSKAAS